MRNANKYGFLPGNDAESNLIALQHVVNLGGEIVVSAPGTGRRVSYLHYTSVA